MMNKNYIAFLVLIIVSFTSCKKNERLTIQKTIDYKDGKADGEILDLSSASHNDYGFCWDSLPNPTVYKHKLSMGTQPSR